MAAKNNNTANGVEPPSAEEENEAVTTTAAPVADPAKKNERKAREKVKSKKQNGFVAFVKKSDPIAMTCFVVIILAFAVVLGSYIHSEYFADSSSGTAVDGSTVEVEYVGSYLHVYDEAGAVIFDTNIKSVGEDESSIFSGSYTVKESYEVMSFTIGAGKVLKAFGDACAGHKVGDVVTVTIPASDVTDSSSSEQSYGKLPRVEDQTRTYTFNKNGSMSLEMFNAVTGKSFTADALSSPTNVAVLEGVDVVALYTDSKVNYTFVSISDNENAKLVTGAEVSVTAAETTFTLTYKAQGDAVLKAIIPDATGNMQAAFVEHKVGQDTISYWISDNSDNAEQKGETMYFYIKIKSIS